MMMMMRQRDLVLCIFSALLVTGNTDCPTWCVAATKEMTAGFNNEECECGASVDGAINCDHYTEQMEIRLGWCMTDLNKSSDSRQSHDLKSNLTSTVIIGKCSYVPIYNATNRAYTSLPSDPFQLTHVMCDHYHRTGLLCGQCVDGYGPSVYSFDLRCSNCSVMSVATAVILRMLLEFLPSGLFFIFIMVSLCLAQCLVTLCSVSHSNLPFEVNHKFMIQCSCSYPHHWSLSLEFQ